MLKLLLEPHNNPRLARLCGPLNAHLHQVESRFDVEIHHRGHDFELVGDGVSVAAVAEVLRGLYRRTEQEDLSADGVNRFLQEAAVNALQGGQVQAELVLRKSRVQAYGDNQKRYLAALRDHDIVFSVGPAGTGKTYLAIAQAVHALEQDQVQRIILVRPVVEAGERLGFLPGDLVQKIDPYLRPMYDALYELMGHEPVAKLIEHHRIEVAPLAYMRGRTLADAFVILDEAQNASREQMKMFLTRIGFGSRVVITGDTTQSDLPESQRPGLVDALDRLAGVPDIAFIHLSRQDVIRHPLVQHIIDAYDCDR